MIHSPIPGIRLPFHSPAGIAYRPQWMKRPYFASWNQARRFAFAGSARWAAAAGQKSRATPPSFAATAPLSSRETSASSGGRLEPERITGGLAGGVADEE